MSTSTTYVRKQVRVGVIMRLTNLIPTNAKLQLFKSSILPILTYCHRTWHFCKASDTRKLERIQERGLRAIFKDSLSTYQQLLDRAKLPTLLEIRERNKPSPTLPIDNFSKLSKRQIDLTITGRGNAIKEHNIWPQILTTHTGNYFTFKLLVAIFTFKISILFY